jgi:hypothetical protein
MSTGLLVACEEGLLELKRRMDALLQEGVKGSPLLRISEEDAKKLNSLQLERDAQLGLLEKRMLAYTASVSEQFRLLDAQLQQLPDAPLDIMKRDLVELEKENAWLNQAILAEYDAAVALEQHLVAQIDAQLPKPSQSSEE